MSAVVQKRPHRSEAAAWRLLQWRSGKWFTRHEAARALGIFDLDDQLRELEEQGHQVERRQLRSAYGAVLIQYRVTGRAQR